MGQINCCKRLRKVAQSAINCPIWSHWLGDETFHLKRRRGYFFSAKLESKKYYSDLSQLAKSLKISNTAIATSATTFFTFHITVLETISFTNFRVAQQWSAGIKLSDWLKVVRRFETANQCAWFQSSVLTLL